MVAVPAEKAVARPLLLIVATDISVELQMTCVVILKLVPSEYVPVAVNCRVAPIDMLGLAGVINMEERVAEFTVRVVLPDILPEVAVMVALPATTAVAWPLLLMVATDAFDELQLACGVIS